jgi:hypothetical protein
VLSLVYLLLLGALAGAIPVIFELAGCLLTLGLKLAYDHTAWGRQQQQQQAAEIEQQLCEVLCAIEEQQECEENEEQQQQQQQHKQHSLLECQLPIKQQAAEDSTTHCILNNSSGDFNLQPQQQQQQLQQHYSNSTAKQSFRSDEPLYRDEPGFSSDGGAATVSVQLSTKAAAAAANGSAQTAAQSAAPCDVRVVVYQNPLAARDSIAGTTAVSSAASSADGAVVAQKPIAAAALEKQNNGFYRRPAALYTPGSSLSGATVSATAALALAVQQLQQQQHKQQPWYMRTGIRHGASIPTSSAGGVVLPSAASVIFAASTEQRQPQSCCQCCHVCGAQQLPQQQQQRSAGASTAGRLSLFGQGVAAYLSGGNRVRSRTGTGHVPTSSRSSSQGTIAGCNKSKNAQLRKRPSLDMPHGGSNWQSEHQPERSSMSLSSLGLEAWQALRQRSVMLLSLTGINSSRNRGGATSRNAASNAQQFEDRQQQGEAVVYAAATEAGTLQAAAAAAPTDTAAAQATADGASPKQRQQLAAGSSRRLKLLPVLPVIQSEPCTPRAFGMAAEGGALLPAEHSKVVGSRFSSAAAAAAATAAGGAAAAVQLPGDPEQGPLAEPDLRRQQ